MDKSDSQPTFSNRVAVVTGGTRGMGLAICRALLNGGAKVMAVYKSNSAAANKAKEELSKISSEVEIVQADVGQKTSAQKIAEKAGNKWKRIDILVNNAGIFDFAFLHLLSESNI